MRVSGADASMSRIGHHLPEFITLNDFLL